MEYNIDLIIAGCSTNCRHCYVDGGPAPVMPYEDVLLCLKKLQPAFDKWGKGITFTLDNEAYLHPQLPEILRYIYRECPENDFHHGSTTGIAFNHRRDKDQLWALQKELGLDHGCITLHGGQKNHEFLTQTPKSFAESLEYARYLRKNGGKMEVNLMLSRLLADDREELAAVLEDLRPDAVYLTVTNAAPNRRLWDYQQWRASLADCEKLQGWLSRWGLEERPTMERLRGCTHRAWTEQLERQGLPQEPDHCFLTVHTDLTLWQGNTGVEQRCLGDLRRMTEEELLAALEACTPNWNFYPWAFRQPPAFEQVLAYAKTHPAQDLLYPDADSLLSRMTQELLKE